MKRRGSRFLVPGSGTRALGERWPSAVFVALTFAIVEPGTWNQELSAQTPRGKAVYDKWCAGCHGETGAGDGPSAAYMMPRPRDFTRGVYKIRSTASGEIPTDADLLHIIDKGMPATAMPDWESLLSASERNDLVTYIKSFYPQFASSRAATPLQFGNAPGSSDASIADGRATYQKLECFKCHGQQGRGDGNSAPTLKDDWDHPIRAADLSESWKFRGGNTVEEIYARLKTGLDGTPMPSFQESIENKLITDEQLWHVAQYVRSLSPEEPPPVREVLRAPRVVTLPRTVDDSAWNAADRQWVPVVGQIIIKPRWFAPTVDGIWVQALHDGQRLSMRLTWHDPSSSPNPIWNEWLGRVASSVTNADGAVSTQQGPDRLAVQFPITYGEGAEKPFFLQGTTRRPVYLWRWTSSPDRVEIGNATGLGKFTPHATAADVSHQARFDAGEWRVQITRPLAASDTTRVPRFMAGQPIPIGFFVADGSNGEDEVRGAVSGWYALYLDVPTPASVYVAPAVTTLLTAGLGFIVVARARRRGRSSDQSTEV
jgi:DMSO reductase family type II enzyme heme b subunit